MTASLEVIGVRHHSPACAGLVRDRIRALKPAYVLIEGPVDMNERLEELTLGHTLPVAIFSFYASESHTSSSWSPFCDYSPEWVAVEEAFAAGAQPLFMDLPAWAPAFEGVTNRYRDPEQSVNRERVLCEEVGVDGVDALWDHLFEQPMSSDELRARLNLYFKELRGDDPPGQDLHREEHMARCIKWAMDQDEGPVIAVCGGWHKPALEEAVHYGTRSWPDLIPAEEDARHGSYLVPYSFRRLDSFTGYQSGMPSPGWYQATWEQGPEAAADTMLERAVKALRARKQVVSAADVIAVSLMSEGLRRLRGHDALARVDLLDGMASALIKGALDEQLPWSGRGTLQKGTDPMLVEVVHAFSGDRVGKLAEGTPRPPLLFDVQALLEAQSLAPPTDVTLDLEDATDLERSRTLHRLRVLGVPGFTRTAGPDWATDAVFEERWRVREQFETESSLIEAAAYGATLPSAAAAKLEEAMLAADGALKVLTDLIGEAAFIGLDSLAGNILDKVASAVSGERSLPILGSALAKLLALWRDGRMLGAERSTQVVKIVEAAFDRGLWLAEACQGATAPADPKRLGAMIAMRDTLRVDQSIEQDTLDVDETIAWATFERISKATDSPPGMRGAALGLLWSSGYWSSPTEASSGAEQALAASSAPEVIGDFLAGLFALAREEAVSAPGLIASVDRTLASLDDRDFIRALPALRLGFEYFPPMEREALARSILGLHGGDEADAKVLTQKLAVAPQTIAAGAALDHRVAVLAQKYGLILEATDG